MSKTGQTASFTMAELLQERADSTRPWLEFLNLPTMSMGIYHVAAGTDDRATHQPHERDEIYVGVSGRGRLSAAGEQFVVEQGSIVFVKSGIEHYFYDVTSDLTVLVFFAGASTESGS